MEASVRRLPRIPRAVHSPLRCGALHPTGIRAAHAVATGDRIDLATFRVVATAMPGALLLLDRERHAPAWSRDVPAVLPAVAGAGARPLLGDLVHDDQRAGEGLPGSSRSSTRGT